MIHPALRYVPKQNPCAQCGQPIAAPDWIEELEDRTVYLWRCYACDYRFEAIAFFDEMESHAQSHGRRLAA
jgi:hypothetical protein